MDSSFVVPSNDYHSNLEVTDRFPFNLYHNPIRDSVLNVIAEESSRGPLRILNVGCGRSQILKKIDPAHEYFAVDIDPRNVELCRQRYADRRATFELCQEYQLPFESESMDVVFATEVVEHILDPVRWLGELFRVLRPGGRLQLSTPNYGDLTLPLIESTFLELVARMQGFTRKGLHPTPFHHSRLYELLQRAGLEEILVQKTPARLALVASARRPSQELVPLDRQRLKGMWTRLRSILPSALAAREIARMVVLSQRLHSGHTVLDVGCGDGSVWQCFPGVRSLVLDGVDLNPHELKLAAATGVYRNLILADISQTQPQQTYDFVVGNCSMEHVPNIHGALQGMRGLIRPGGQLILLVPANGWSKSMKLVSRLALLSPRLGMALSGAIDGFFQHHHLYDATSWRLLVENAGYEVQEFSALGSPALNQFFDENLLPAAVEFVAKSVLKHYADLSGLRRTPCEEFFTDLARQPVSAEDPFRVEYVIVARPRT